ncbi:MAG TPA: HD-GYP domain-containing protein, partial [Bacillota bacterium]|nr:HD-GYP domain-containing protein [Bacillota bacterium]
EIFLKKIVLYPVGSIVRLSNGKRGMVIENYPYSFMRPKVRIISDNPNDPEEIYDLYNDPSLLNVTILGIYKPNDTM